MTEPPSRPTERPPDWPALLAARQQAPTLGLRVAETILTVRRTGAGGAVYVACDDGEEYVIKGSHFGRATVNEQIVGRLGRVLGAPVPAVVLVDVPELLAADLRRRFSDRHATFPAGLAHGLRREGDCGDRRGVEHVTAPGNRARFALLAVLYGWIPAGDMQFIYKDTPPRHVYSVDHGMFFPEGPDWTLESLGRAQPPGLAWAIADQVRFTPAEVDAACAALAACTADDVAQAVSAPPAGWDLTDAERLAVAEYLWTRRRELLERPRVL